MFIVGQLKYKRKYWGWDTNRGAALAKTLIESCACVGTKTGFSTKINIMKCMPLLLLFYLSWSCLGVDEISVKGSWGKKISFQLKEWLCIFKCYNSLQIIIISMFTRHWKKNNLHILVFCWILLLLRLLPVPSQNMSKKLKASETHVWRVPYFLALRR